MAKVELVFRSVGERTRDVALELAVRHIRPSRVHLLEGVRPFAETVRRMLRIEHDADQVVHLDADCLLQQDMVPFLERNSAAYVECHAADRFTGRGECGVHVTRADLLRAMARSVPSLDDRAFVLRPETRTRSLAMRRHGMDMTLRSFWILHDWFQFHRDIFAKNALREVRSREPHVRAELERKMSSWPEDDVDGRVARRGIEHARRHVPPEASAAELHAYIEALPRIAEREMAEAGIAEKGPFTMDDFRAWEASNPHKAPWTRKRPRVFGIGLSRTGTRSVNAALRALGFRTIHYPDDPATLEDLVRGNHEFRVLEEYDGITDITVANYYAQLDQLFPGSKFILTVRDLEPWLESARKHWAGRPPFEPSPTPAHETHMRIRRLLRATVYGCYDFQAHRFAEVYQRHLRDVTDHFAGRPESLLVLDVCRGEGWEKLCPFLGVGVPDRPFPRRFDGPGGSDPDDPDAFLDSPGPR